MDYRVRRSVGCRSDIETIFDHLTAAYIDLGDPLQEALSKAAGRIECIEDDIDALGRVPHQGTLWPEVMKGLRWVTKNRAIFYFQVDDVARSLDVLAVFYGGQDHRSHALARIRKG